MKRATNSGSVTELVPIELQWWRDHVAYAVTQRQEMRVGHVIPIALMLMAVAAAPWGAAPVAWPITISVLEFTAVFLALDLREWIKSERNYARSLRIRRAGLAEAEMRL